MNRVQLKLLLLHGLHSQQPRVHCNTEEGLLRAHVSEGEVASGMEGDLTSMEEENTYAGETRRVKKSL